MSLLLWFLQKILPGTFNKEIGQLLIGLMVDILTFGMNIIKLF